MNRTRLGPAVVLIPLVLGLSLLPGVGTATASRTLPRPDHPDQRPNFTKAEAQDILAEAKSQLRPDTRRVRAHQPVGDGVDTDITMTLRDLYLARPELTGSDRQEADEMLSRGRVSYGDDDPMTLRTPSTRCSESFCVHYRKSPLSESATLAQVETTLETLEHVRSFQTGILGYRAPVSDAPAVSTTDNPDKRLDVFLGDLSEQGLYGYCSPDGAERDYRDGRAAAFCVLDNDYSTSQYGGDPIDSLRVTAAHEYFHAVQFGYDVHEDHWFMEGTATWVEEQLYDEINDNYQYLSTSPIRTPGRSADYSLGRYPYGAFLFFKYAEERLNSRIVMRQFWEYADASKDRYSLQAIRAVIAARKTNWTNLFTQFASWNAYPTGSYSEGAEYPAPTLTLNKTLSNSATSTGWQTRELRHLSSSTVRIVPSSTLSTSKDVLIEINGPNTSHGTNALILRRYRDGRVTRSMIPLDSAGDARLVRDFNRVSISSMYLVLSNTSTSMKDCGEVTTADGEPWYSCYGRGTYDSGQTYKVRATLR